MKIEGKHKHTFEIEYEICSPKTLYYDNDPKITINFNFNKKQVRAYKKGIKTTAKYLAKMKLLGFTLVEQKGGAE